MNSQDMGLPKAAYINLGCRVNRVEIDSIAYDLEQAGIQTVSADDADVIVINTCAVTGEAEAKTRKQIRHAADLPQKPVVLATGCVANLFSDELEALADNVVVETNKSEVAQRIREIFDIDIAKACTTTQAMGSVTPTGRTRPGIKIQDGCDNRCTYCIVWKARGAARSLPSEEVLERVLEVQNAGAQEVVLTGINLAAWNQKTGEIRDLADLLEYLMEHTAIKRFRLSSIEPPETTEKLLRVIADSNSRIAPFLHLALQSGSDATLRRMDRHYTTQEYAEVVAMARKLIPNLALGCDLIVGFPGETDAEFAESLQFCQAMGFEKMHVFRYSKRPGTPAADMPNQIDPKVMQVRAAQAREFSLSSRKQAALSLVGTVQDILVQAPGVGITGGLFTCKVNPQIPVNSYIKAPITSARGDILSTLAG